MSEAREKAIRERAYALWEKSGSGHGQHGEHWDQATREIDAEMAGQSAPKGAKRGPKPKATAAAAAAPAAAKPARATKATPEPVAAPSKPAPGPKPRTVAKKAANPEAKPIPAAVGKAKQAADKVVATVKRATKASPKK